MNTIIRISAVEVPQNNYRWYKNKRVLQKVSHIWKENCLLSDGKSTLIPMAKSGCNNSGSSELPNSMQSTCVLEHFTLSNENNIFIYPVFSSMWPCADIIHILK